MVTMTSTRRRWRRFLFQCTSVLLLICGGRRGGGGGVLPLMATNGLSTSSSSTSPSSSKTTGWRNHGQQQPHPPAPSQLEQRRAFLLRTTAIAAAAGGAAAAALSRPSQASAAAAVAAVAASPVPTATAQATATASRDDLLRAIAARRPESEVLQIIDRLPPVASPATVSNLDGAWKLLWSCKADAFSPLLKLPPPFRPDSFQYWGAEAAREVGEGRLAQGLTGGALLPNKQLWLSSGYTIPDEQDDPSLTVQILPPFRLQLGGRAGTNDSKPKTTLLEAGSDADFRKVNARTLQEQQAGANLYRQVYVEQENSGGGALRVSKIVAGDPVIVGAVFVHQKL